MSEQVLTWKVDGLKELDDNLRALSSDIAPKWTNGGLRAGVRVIQLAAQGGVPVQSGLLKGTIRIRRGKKTREDNVREYFLFAGSRVKGGGGAFYAEFVEKGTKAHDIRAFGGGHLHIGSSYYTVVHHPGAKAKPFMETAARTSAQAAFQAFGNYIRAKVERTGKLNPAAETE